MTSVIQLTEVELTTGSITYMTADRLGTEWKSLEWWAFFDTQIISVQEKGSSDTHCGNAAGQKRMQEFYIGLRISKEEESWR